MKEEEERCRTHPKLRVYRPQSINSQWSVPRVRVEDLVTLREKVLDMRSAL